MTNKNLISVIQCGNETMAHYRDSDNDVTRYFNIKGEEVEIPASNETIQEDELKISFPPWSFEQDLIDQVGTYLRKFIYLENDVEYSVISLFIMLSYSVNSFERIPYLSLQGPKGSGKTALLTVMKSLVYNPIFVSETSHAALFRLIDANRPTLFLDEVESLNNRNTGNNQVFQILNSGYQKDGLITRVSGKKVNKFKTFGLKIMAGINPLFSTLEDRCIVLNLSQPSNNFKHEIFNGNYLENTSGIIQNILSGLMHSYKNINEMISNPEKVNINNNIRLRQLDKWFPILTLAKLFSTNKNSYFDQIQNYALDNIDRSKESELILPENMCRGIIKDFLADKAGRTKIKDPDYFYFRTEEIQNIIKTNDPHNTYKYNAEITRILKRIGVETDRRRFGSGPVSLYKIPKTILK